MYQSTDEFPMYFNALHSKENPRVIMNQANLHFSEFTLLLP